MSCWWKNRDLTGSFGTRVDFLYKILIIQQIDVVHAINNTIHAAQSKTVKIVPSLFWKDSLNQVKLVNYADKPTNSLLRLRPFGSTPDHPDNPVLAVPDLPPVPAIVHHQVAELQGECQVQLVSPGQYYPVTPGES